MEYTGTIKWFALMLVAGCLLAGCAGTPNVNPLLQEVQREYNNAAEDSVVVNNAQDELKKAREAVSEVRTAIVENESETAIEQKVKLARQRIQIAQKAAALRAARASVERNTAELRAMLDTLQKMQGSVGAAAQIEQPVEERAQNLRHFQARQSDRGLVIRFLDLRFAQEKAMLTSSVEQPINELANFLSDYPERTILIEGHTDNTGAASFNKTLSQQRADVVRDALISRGVDPDRIRAVGLGEQYPIASNDTEVGRRENRRVEVIISDESGNIPERE